MAYLSCMHASLAATTALILVSIGTASAGTVYCSDLKTLSATSGWSTVQKDKSIDQKPITLKGVVYPKGLGTHSPSEIVYALDGRYALFAADVGLDDETSGKGSVEFQVFVDDSLIFKSGILRGGMAPQGISVNVAGGKKLKLVATIGGDSYDWDDADWAGARLTEIQATGIHGTGRGFRSVGLERPGQRFDLKGRESPE